MLTRCDLNLGSRATRGQGVDASLGFTIEPANARALGGTRVSNTRAALRHRHRGAHELVSARCAHLTLPPRAEFHARTGGGAG